MLKHPGKLGTGTTGSTVQEQKCWNIKVSLEQELAVSNSTGISGTEMETSSKKSERSWF